jgi:hypothetical protein
MLKVSLYQLVSANSLPPLGAAGSEHFASQQLFEDEAGHEWLGCDARSREYSVVAGLEKIRRKGGPQ